MSNTQGDDAGEAPASTTRTVRHAYVSWEVLPTKAGEPFQQFRIMRGETFDFPTWVVERYEPFGAFEPVTGQVPPTFGTVPLTEDSSDEAFVRFVGAASAVEVARFVRDNPDLEGRITDALAVAAGEVVGAPPQGPVTVDGVATSDGTEDPTAGQANPMNNPDGTANDDGGATTPDPNYKDPGVLDPAEVVKGSAQDVLNYLSDHPDQANNVLQAENARTDGKPRAGVVKAAEAAAAHNG